MALCRRLLAVLSPLDLASLSGLEQLRARRTRYHVFRPVAPPFTHERLICVVSFHLLPAAAPSTHGLLLWPNPGCNQEGEFILICYIVNKGMLFLLTNTRYSMLFTHQVVKNVYMIYIFTDKKRKIINFKIF